MPISCHFRDCKALLVTSLTHVSVAIATVQNFTFTFTGEDDEECGKPSNSTCDRDWDWVYAVNNLGRSDRDD